MATLIMKFGGTSVGSAEAINQAADIVVSYAGEWRQAVVVAAADATGAVKQIHKEVILNG